jgi:cell division protein FtsB
MSEEERLRVQNSVSLSIALLSLSTALIAGAVAAFFAIVDKIPSGRMWLVLVVVVSIAFLTLSIYFGGKGVSATNNSIKEHPDNLELQFDSGNFNLQAVAGLAGLFFGAVAFLLLSAVTVKGTDESNKKISSLERQIAQIRIESAKLQARNEILYKLVSDLNSKLATAVTQAADKHAGSSPSTSQSHRYHRNPH